MTKKLFITSFFTLFLLLTNNAFSQQTNAKEDYSAYLPEVRAFNQQLAQMAQGTGTSILTKEGLAAARNSMAPTILSNRNFNLK
jgi:hypothetical protein